MILNSSMLNSRRVSLNIILFFLKLLPFSLLVWCVHQPDKISTTLFGIFDNDNSI